MSAAIRITTVIAWTIVIVMTCDGRLVNAILVNADDRPYERPLRLT